MNKFFSIMLSICLFGSIGIIKASEQWTSGVQKVDAIQWRPDLKGFYTAAGTFNDPNSCSTTGFSANFYELSSIISSDQAEMNRQLSLLMLAKSTGGTVFVRVNGCGAKGPSFIGLEVH